MGANAETQVISGRTAREAFSEAQDRAGRESGYSYSGTISQAAGFFLATTEALLAYEAQKRADALLGDDDGFGGGVEKWGPAGLVPVVPAESTRTVSVTVDVTGLDWRGRRKAEDTAVRGKLKPGEQIESLKSEDGESKFKIVTTTTEGPAVTRYVVASQHRTMGRYPTLTEAKVQAKALLERDRWTESLAITKVTARDSEPLVVVKRVPVKQTVKITATVGKPKRVAPQEWVAAGIYSS